MKTGQSPHTSSILRSSVTTSRRTFGGKTARRAAGSLPNPSFAASFGERTTRQGAPFCFARRAKSRFRVRAGSHAGGSSEMTAAHSRRKRNRKSAAARRVQRPGVSVTAGSANSSGSGGGPEGESAAPSEAVPVSAGVFLSGLTAFGAASRAVSVKSPAAKGRTEESRSAPAGPMPSVLRSSFFDARRTAPRDPSRSASPWAAGLVFRLGSVSKSRISRHSTGVTADGIPGKRARRLPAGCPFPGRRDRRA